MQVCLVATFALVAEQLIRFWKGRSLTLGEVVSTGLVGFIAYLAVVPVLCVGQVLYDNLGFQSFAEVLAVGVIASLVALFGLLITFVRARQCHRPTSGYQSAMALASTVACAVFALFLWQRAVEGRAQQQLITALKSQSCLIYYDYMVGLHGHLDSKSSTWVPERLSSVLGIDFFHRIVRVDLESAGTTVDQLVPPLSALTHLEYLSVPGGMPDTDVRQLKAGLPSCKFRIFWTPDYEETSFE